MGLSLHQHGAAVAGANNASFNIGAISAGDCIVVYTHGDVGAGTWTVSDGVNPNGNYVQKLAAVNFSPFGNAVFVLANSAAIANATITVSHTVGTNQCGLIIHVWTGADTTAPFDVGVTASGTSSTPASGNTATSAGGNEVILGFSNAGGESYTAQSGFTLDDNQLGPGSSARGSEHQLISGSVAAQSASFTMNASDSWNCSCAVIKEARAVPILRVPRTGQLTRQLGNNNTTRLVPIPPLGPGTGTSPALVYGRFTI